MHFNPTRIIRKPRMILCGIVTLTVYAVWNIIQAAKQLQPGSYESLDQNDEDLIAYTRRTILEPPDTKPYNLTASGNPDDEKELETKQNPTPIFNELFKNKKTGGIFFEAGAYDGCYLSTTLMLEKDYKWTGLLVEGNPENVAIYRLRHRKAWFAPVLISTEKHAMRAQMALLNARSYVQPLEDVVRTFKCGESFMIGYSNNELKQLLERRDCVPYDNRRMVQSIPLYTLLKASGFTEIDFFTLDVEGAEVRILKTIPFDKVTIKVFLIEVIHSDKSEVINIMKKNDYAVISTINGLDIPKIRNNDLLFVKKGLLERITYTTEY